MTVSKDARKDVIFSAYQDVLQKLQQVNAAKLDPAGEVAAKKTVQTLDKAEATVEGSVADKIATLQKNIVNVLGGLAGQLNEEIETFNNLQAAIDLKELELQELFGLEKEAFALAALINTQNEQRERFATEMDEKRTNLRNELDELNQQIRDQRIAFQKEIADLKQQTATERKREQEEYSYSFARSKQQAQDSFDDELAAKRKQFEEEVEVVRDELSDKTDELEKRESEIEAKEDKFSELEAKVAAFPAKETEIRNEAYDQARREEQKVMAIKEGYIKRDFDSQKAVLDSKVGMLENSLTEAKAEAAELRVKLDEAYGKIQNMALESVKSANESKALDKFTQALSNNQNNK